MDTSKCLLLAACVGIAIGGAAGPVRADDTSKLPVAVSLGPQLHSQSQVITTDTSPVTLRLLYTGEEADNAIGGLHTGTTYMNNILAQFGVDTASAFGWPGGRFVVEGFYENKDSLDAQFVNAVQDPSVIDTSGSSMFRLYQAYYKQDLGHTNVLLGVYDLQTEFGTTKPSDLFFNGAYGWTTTLDQSGLNGPSTYPNTSLALRIREKLSAHWRLQAAILDGVPDSAKDPRVNSVNINKTNGALLIAELDYLPSRYTKIMAGYWDYTGQFQSQDRFDSSGGPRQVSGADGGYIGGATRLYSQSAHRGLDAFANLGFADSETQQIDGSLSAGLTYTGLLGARPFDKLGVAVGIARASSPYKRMQVASGEGVDSYETNFELTYRAPITNWLTVQPDVQYWINPGLTPTQKNDLLFIVHFEVSHLFNL